MDDAQLLGAGSAARRLQAHAGYRGPPRRVERRAAARIAVRPDRTQDPGVADLRAVIRDEVSPFGAGVEADTRSPSLNLNWARLVRT